MAKSKKTNNQKLFTKIAIALIAIFIALIFISKLPKRDKSNLINASYSNGSVKVEAIFDNTAKTVTFTEASIGTITLPQALSASGARYANKDESIVFWEHQGELTITNNGKI